MATPTPTPTQTPTPTPSLKRTFTPEEIARMSPMARAMLEQIMMEATKIPVKPTKGAKSNTPSPTPTPTKTKVPPKVGKWVIDPETNVKVYDDDPRFKDIVRKWGPSGNLESGEDKPKSVK